MIYYIAVSGWSSGGFVASDKSVWLAHSIRYAFPFTSWESADQYAKSMVSDAMPFCHLAGSDVNIT